MAEKRKKIVLTIREKLNLIAKFEQGECATKLAKEYGIGNQTVRDIIKNKTKLNEFSFISNNGEGSSKRKSMKISHYQELDKAMLEWFTEKRAEGKAISGPMCSKQAKLFHKQLGLEGNFNASSGWLIRFKQRYGICDMRSQQNSPDRGKAVINAFCKEFQQIIVNEKLVPEQIYSASETDLQWNGFSAQILKCKDEELSHDKKNYKNCVTIMCCSNGTGKHKMNLLVVGSVVKAQLFEGSEFIDLPIDYYYHKNSCMDENIFKDWFQEIFVPEVRSHLQSKGLPPKAVLLLDNCPPYKNFGYLSSDDECIYVKYVTSDVSESGKPIAYDIMPSMKSQYRFDILKTFVKEDAKLDDFWERMTLADALHRVSLAWERVETVTIMNSWKKVLSKLEADLEKYYNQSITEHDFLIHDVDEFENIDSKNLKEWLECDVYEPELSEKIRKSNVIKCEEEENFKFGVGAQFKEVEKQDNEKVVSKEH